jgi:non-heme chloroperoxidase
MKIREQISTANITRREVVIGSVSLAALATLAPAAHAAGDPTKGSGGSTNNYRGEHSMNKVSTKDGVEIFYKDWGSGQPIVFSHGWPLSADDWDPQMMFFLNNGFRVIAHDRRGHGRSTQTATGHDMDHYADDLAVVTEHLNLKNAVHIGHSTGGGEVVHYLARHGESRAAKDGRCEGALRWRRRLFSDGFHAGPEESVITDARHAWG